MLWSLMRASTSASHACGSDVVHARGLDQSVHHGGALAAVIGAGEQLRLASAARARPRCW
jgi:hypothetical protein